VKQKPEPAEQRRKAHKKTRDAVAAGKLDEEEVDLQDLDQNIAQTREPQKTGNITPQAAETGPRSLISASKSPIGFIHNSAEVSVPESASAQTIEKINRFQMPYLPAAFTLSDGELVKALKLDDARDTVRMINSPGEIFTCQCGVPSGWCGKPREMQNFARKQARAGVQPTIEDWKLHVARTEKAREDNIVSTRAKDAPIPYQGVQAKLNEYSSGSRVAEKLGSTEQLSTGQTARAFADTKIGPGMPLQAQPTGISGQIGSVGSLAQGLPTVSAVQTRNIPQTHREESVTLQRLSNSAKGEYGTTRDGKRVYDELFGEWDVSARTAFTTKRQRNPGQKDLEAVWNLSDPNNRGRLAWLKRAANRDDSENAHALHELGLLYEIGSPNDYILRDEGHSLQLYTKAAEFGYKYSQSRLGAVYEYGHLGQKIDPRASIDWYTAAVRQDEHQAELALSGWYLIGSDPVLQQSDIEAYLWAKKSADSGLSKAEYVVGYFTETGIGVTPNLEEAKRWYWKAAGELQDLWIW
jgi:Sel1 repeat